MPYVGGSLTSLFGAVPQALTRQVPARIARRAGDRIEELARANTPVESGKLRSAWHQFPVVEIETLLGRGHRVTIANDVEYAAWVESGTGLYGPKHRPYVITPKDPNGMLAWRDPKTGRWVYAKRVLHPGSPGNHMLAIAMHVTEFEFSSGLLGQRELEEWARAIERQAD